MELELRHLRVVCAVAEAGSITQAAIALGMPQPALTAQLQRIERGLGGCLFERDRRGARATPLGELVLARARVVLPAVEGLQDEVTRLANRGERILHYRLGSTNTPILGGLVDRLTAGHVATVSTYSAWSVADLASMVLQGRLDYVLAGACGEPRTSLDPNLTWVVLAVDPVFAVVAEHHELAEKTEVGLADLADSYWAMTPGDECFGECFAAACARAGFTPKTTYEADVAGCLDLVALGHAVALCQPTFRPYPGLVMLPLTGTPLRWRQIIGWHPGGDSPEEIIAHARAAYADAVGRSPKYAEWLADHEDFGLVPPA